nr:MAG TPA: toxin III family protein [Caudoviricetes sp.]
MVTFWVKNGCFWGKNGCFLGVFGGKCDHKKAYLRSSRFLRMPKNA